MPASPENGEDEQCGTDVQPFLLRVRVGTEAHQLTVNKWSPSIYRAGDRKQECRSTSCVRHTHTQNTDTVTHILQASKR